MATRLEFLRTSLELPTCTTDAKLLTDEKDLSELADKCSDTAKDLLKIVRSLKLDGLHNKRQALRKSFKAMWKKDDVEEIQERSNCYKKVLDTRILINPRSVTGHDFVEWLQRGHGTYWMNEKAGSGESPLTNCICEHPWRDTQLEVWSGSTEILSPKFFFWRAGSTLQQSSAGLLRSLNYQILQIHPDPIFSAAQAKLSSPVSRSASQRSKLIPIWTELRFQKALQNYPVDDIK